MSAELVAETIDRWAERMRGYEAESHQNGAERMRNWLFGAGMALQLLDDPALLSISQRALEESMNEHLRNRTLGAGYDGDLGHSRLDSQRTNLPTDVETQR